MIYAVIILTLLVLFGAEILRSEDGDAVKSIVLAASKFICIFCVICLALLAFDRFKYISALLLELTVSIAYLAVVYSCGNKQLRFAFKGSSLCIPLIIICITIPFTAQKAEYFGMGQDEGVYQTEAIKLGFNSTDLSSEFNEYKLLKSGEEKQQYLAFLDSLAGYTRYENNLQREEYAGREKLFKIADSTSGTYHGIHIFSALMGLWAKLFGIGKMLGLMYLIYICSVFLFYYSVENITANRFTLLASTTLFAISPIIIWLSKTTYSESLVVMSFVLYLYYLTQRQKKTSEIISLGTATIYICCQHIMFLILYPAFWLAFIVLSVWEKNHRFIYDIVISAAGLVATSIAFSRISAVYYYDNLSRLFVEPVITLDNIMYWISAGAVASVGIGAILYKVFSGLDKNKLNKALIIVSRAIILLGIVYITMCFFAIGEGNVEQNAYNSYEVYGQGAYVSFYTSLWALCIYCGITVFPYLLLKSIFGKKLHENTGIQVATYVIYIWFVFIYSVILKSEVWYYFYYSRYFGYVVPIVLLYYTLLLDRNCRTERQQKLKWVIPIISLIAMLVMDVPIAQYKDDTIVEWSTLEAIADEIGRDDAVLFTGSTALRYALAIDNITGAGIYPLMTDVRKELDLLSDNYDNIFVLSENNDAIGILQESGAAYDISLQVNNKMSYNRVHFINGYYFENYHDSNNIILHQID